MMPETDTALDRLGVQLAPDFHLLRPLGEGAMACVYLAREAALERLVALKVLRPEFARDAAAARRFEREARSAARLAHPNVAAVHRVGALGDGTPWIAMEYVDGRTLADVLASQGPLAPERARAALAQLASALAAAHGRGVIHRDVRPGNVLVERDTGRLVLADFGIAAGRETGSSGPTRLTPLGMVLGDPRYISPEQLLGEPIGEQTDVYSLGVVGYEVLTGEGPFPRGTDAQTVTAHLSTAPRPLRTLRPGVDTDTAALLERCLAKKPAHRPSAGEVAAALAGAPRPHPVPAAEAPAAAPLLPAVAAFLRELERRRVYRALFAYLVGAFGLLQGADAVLPVLPLPAWSFKVMVAVVLGAFPVVMVLTWIFDVNQSGIQRTAEIQAGELPARARTARLALQVAGVAVSILLAALVGWWILW